MTNDNGNRITKAAVRRTESTILILLALFTFTALVLVGSVRAQAPIPPTEELEKAKAEVKVAIDQCAKQAADEYIEALEQLQTTLNDYSSYFSRVNDATLKAYQISFEQFARGIDRGTYAENPDFLDEDMTAFIKNLKEQEAKLKENPSDENKKLYKLIYSLRKEMTILNDLVQGEIAHRLQQYCVNQEQVQKYLELAVKQQKIHIKTIEQAAKAAHYAHAGDTVLVAPIPDIEVPQIVVRPVTPVTPETPEVPFEVQVGPKGSQIGLVRKYVDTLPIASSQTPIYITQPAGQLTVNGWNRNMVVATLEVEVVASTHEAEKVFVSKTALRIAIEKNGYYIEAVFPKLTDPQTKVVNATMVLSVPQRNPIICDNSFGSVTATNIGADLMIKGRYSTISATEIGGNLRIENSMRPISLSNIFGTIDVLNSNAPVSLSSCEGDITIRNQSGVINVVNSKGDLSLVNSGSITVLDHTGQVDIENSNGPVKVMNLTGDLKAYNSFQPMVIRYVDGSVNVENSNSEIKASQVAGSLEATNKFGNIIAEDLGGPIRLSSENGNVLVTLGDDLTGISSITTMSGNISISIPKNSDMMLTAVAENGGINSSFPMQIQDHQRGQSGEIKLGNGDNKLSLKGKNSTIVIKETK